MLNKRKWFLCVTSFTLFISLNASQFNSVETGSLTYCHTCIFSPFSPVTNVKISQILLCVVTCAERPVVAIVTKP